ncbi:PREDICTED: protein SPHAR, partial [Rhinopithecus bieti]
SAEHRDTQKLWEVTRIKISVCICFRYFEFCFFYALNILFQKVSEANSQTELLLRPHCKNVLFNVSFMIDLQAAHFEQLLHGIGACLF